MNLEIMQFDIIFVPNNYKNLLKKHSITIIHVITILIIVLINFMTIVNI
jgi:hypothetical protein